MGLRRIDGYTTGFDRNEYARTERNQLIRKLILAFFEFAAILLIVLGILYIAMDTGMAESQYCWVMCSPDSYVCVREKPRKTSDGFGGATLGTRLETDGKTKNGFLHVINVPAEETEGWVSLQHVVYDEPVQMKQAALVVSNGKLAARKGINGKVKTWLQPMTEVTILIYSKEWCLTNYGYCMTEFLEWVGGN